MILKKIFYNLRRKVKLKIVKHNKKLLYKLNIKENEFENFKLLKKFNERFDLSINDIDTAILVIENTYYGNELLSYLKYIEFTE